MQVPLPLRGIPNGAGSEVVFSLLRHPELSTAQFATEQLLIENQLPSFQFLREGDVSISPDAADILPATEHLR